jgi:hypothetical protein
VNDRVAPQESIGQEIYVRKNCESLFLLFVKKRSMVCSIAVQYKSEILVIAVFHEVLIKYIIGYQSIPLEENLYLPHVLFPVKIYLFN